MRRYAFLVILIGLSCLLVFLSPTAMAYEEPEIVALLIGFKTTGPEMVAQAQDLTRELYTLLQDLPYYRPLTRPEMEEELQRAGFSTEELLENPRRDYPLQGDLLLLGELEKEALRYHLYYPKTNTWQSSSIPWESQRKTIAHFSDLLKKSLFQGTITDREGLLIALPHTNHALLAPGQKFLVTRPYHQLYTHIGAQVFPNGEIIIGEIRIRSIDEKSVNGIIIREDQPIRVGDRAGFPLDVMGLGTITLITDPPGSRIYLEGRYLGESPLILRDIPAKRYTFTFELENYARSEETIQVRAGRHDQGKVTLAPLPGRVHVTSNRASDVYINDQKMGAAPWKGELSPGPYTIEVRSPGYPTARRTFICQSNREHSFYLPIYGRPGSLYLTTNPSGALVFEKGRRIGITPFYWRDQEPGFYILEIYKDGYRRLEEEFLIYSGEENPFHLILEEAPGYFTFITTPEGASIYYEGRFEGRTPLTLELPRGFHEITIKKEGFLEERTLVESLPEKREVIQKNLQQLYGNLQILSEPLGAEVYRGDEFLGLTPLLLEDLPAGRFTFTLKLGARSQRREVLISPYETETLFMEMKEASPFSGFILGAYDRKIGLFGVELGISTGQRHQFELELTHLLARKAGGYGSSYTEAWGRYQLSFFEGLGVYAGYQMIFNPVESTGYSAGLAFRLSNGRAGGRLGPYLREDTTGILWEAWYRGLIESRINPMIKIGSRPMRDFFLSIGFGF